ncbi:MAG: LPS-assembly protein [Candidatus Kentron sp. G]|nr:MAG: LPS-assembly protein [Candidatus Kentron sp. G]VFM97070.1 MAG: LPS-assembly protein [Candidatus Kentron sp. G]VFM97967.1 MAG: LPS-assembly protein [Candidatus Kentron sp. G]
MLGFIPRKLRFFVHPCFAMKHNPRSAFTARVSGYSLLAIFLLSVFGPQTLVRADTDRGPNWSLCEKEFKIPARPIVDGGGGDPGATYLFGNEANLLEENVFTLLGDVQIRRGNRQISADRIEYDKSLETVDAQGNVQAWDAGQYIIGKSAHVNLARSEYWAKDVKFLLMERHGQGTAEKIKVNNSKQIITARDATYTTCPSAGGFEAQPLGKKSSGTEDWQLTAERIKLNKATDRGTARDVTIKFKNVPVLYSPYLTFPLSDKRKTGFLAPSFGTSESVGTETTIPFYWNIAPDRDATFAIRGMTKRGALVQGQYRYLTDDSAGKVELDYLPDDSEYGDHREAFRFQHTGAIAPGWSTGIDFNWVSDKDYLEDMGKSMLASSTRFLEQRIDVRYNGRRWWALGRFQGYQTVDEMIQADDRPYNRLPQVQFGTRFREHNRKLNFQVKGEWIRFHRESDSVTGQRTVGQRIDITPSVTYPLRTSSAFLVPKLSLRHTKYDLDGTTEGKPGSPERTLPIFSLDSGLFLERDTSFGNRAYTQTLEPRVYYLAVPFKDQSDLPVFDTGEYTFNFGKMFRENRFSGPDRQADANQVTVALTTRLQDEQTTEEVFRASIGQVHYLRNRKVYLPDTDDPDLEIIDKDNSSEIITEVVAKVAGKWRMMAGLEYSVEDGATAKSNIDLRYKPGSQRVFNIGYRYDRDYDEQASASFRWPLARNWGVVGRWVYALPESRTMEAVAGFEYDSCCWAARAVVQRFFNGTDENGAEKDFNNTVFLQLELKGLAGVGRKTGEFLREMVPGYQNEF